MANGVGCFYYGDQKEMGYWKNNQLTG